MLQELTQKIVILYHAAFDKRSPLLIKILLLFVIAYLLSPIDLIPDFIPVLGLLDEAILIPIVLKFVYARLPKELLQEYEQTEPADSTEPAKAFAYIGFLMVILIWSVIAYLIYRLFWL